MDNSTFNEWISGYRSSHGKLPAEIPEQYVKSVLAGYRTNGSVEGNTVIEEFGTPKNENSAGGLILRSGDSNYCVVMRDRAGNFIGQLTDDLNTAMRLTSTVQQKWSETTETTSTPGSGRTNA